MSQSTPPARSVVTRSLASLAALLLLIVAYYHSTGHAAIVSAVNASNMDAFFIAAAPALWMFFSWHLAVMALALSWGAVSNAIWLRAACIFVALVSIGDFFFVFSLAGWFPGTYLLLAIVVFLGLAATVSRFKSAIES